MTGRLSHGRQDGLTPVYINFLSLPESLLNIVRIRFYSVIGRGRTAEMSFIMNSCEVVSHKGNKINDFIYSIYSLRLDLNELKNTMHLR